MFKGFIRTSVILIVITSLGIILKAIISLNPGERTARVAANSHRNYKGTFKIRKRLSKDRHDTTQKLSQKVIKNIKALLIFVGYPRSGHTLIGSLLDAHPHIVIANEYNLFQRWGNWRTGQEAKKDLFDALYQNSQKQATVGFRSNNTVRSYQVPNQWQGTFNKTIKVIGDKKGGYTSRYLTSHKDALRELSAEIKLPVKIIHIVRNPFDNIATMLARSMYSAIMRDKLYENPINETKLLTKFIILYFKMATSNVKILKQLGKHAITLYSEENIANPIKAVKKLCRFLGVTCSDEYLQDCAKIIYEKPSRTRHTVVWTEEAKDLVVQKAAKVWFLQKYSFES